MSSRTLRPLTAAALFVAALTATAFAAETGTTPCEDAAYRIYNSCLVTSDTFWERLLCDYAFQFNMHSCQR
ncbi:MAG: hypothetical protein ABIV28_06050 [Longimicrobiales bacterium]